MRRLEWAYLCYETIKVGLRGALYCMSYETVEVDVGGAVLSSETVAAGIPT
jgi:hypothetical protein